MEMPLNALPGSAVVKDAAAEIAHADAPQLRLLRIAHRTSDYPLRDVDAPWTTCTPQTAAEFSAVAYFFGREVQKHEHVPIGLIDATWGGTPAEAWTSLDALGADAALMPIFATRAERMDHEATEMRLAPADKLARDPGKPPAPRPQRHPHPPS